MMVTYCSHQSCSYHLHPSRRGRRQVLRQWRKKNCPPQIYEITFAQMLRRSGHTCRSVPQFCFTWFGLFWFHLWNLSVSLCCHPSLSFCARQLNLNWTYIGLMAIMPRSELQLRAARSISLFCLPLSFWSSLISSPNQWGFIGLPCQGCV